MEISLKNLSLKELSLDDSFKLYLWKNISKEEFIEKMKNWCNCFMEEEEIISYTDALLESKDLDEWKNKFYEMISLDEKFFYQDNDGLIQIINFCEFLGKDMNAIYEKVIDNFNNYESKNLTQLLYDKGFGNPTPQSKISKKSHQIVFFSMIANQIPGYMDFLDSYTSYDFHESLEYGLVLFILFINHPQETAIWVRKTGKLSHIAQLAEFLRDDTWDGGIKGYVDKYNTKTEEVMIDKFYKNIDLYF